MRQKRITHGIGEIGKSRNQALGMKYSEELAKVDKKHSVELAKVNTKHSDELNAVKLELADVKNKQTEKTAQHMAEITTLKNDVAMVEFKSTLEEKPMAIFSVFSNKSETLPAASFIGFDYNFIENRGNNFDMQNGIFTAPYEGIYEFDFCGSGSSSGAVKIEVIKNGLVINRFYSGSSPYAHISQSLICSLEKGDTIRLRLRTQMFTNLNMYRTFSGKLLSHSP